MGELVLEPAGHHVDGETAAGEVIGRRSQLGQHGRLPQSRVYRGDDLQALRGQQQCQAEAGGLVLVFGTVAGLVAHLGQRVVEAVVLRRLGQLDVVVVTPVRALLDVAGDQAAADIGHPVRELDVVCDPFSRHGVPSQQRGQAAVAGNTRAEENQIALYQWMRPSSAFLRGCADSYAFAACPVRHRTTAGEDQPIRLRRSGWPRCR